MTRLTEVEGLTAADVVHRRLTTLPASTTVGELRAYFAASPSRRLAVFVDGERYAGCVVLSDLPDDTDDAQPAVTLAGAVPTVPADATAAQARDAALHGPCLRAPVTDDVGRFVGIVAIDQQHENFCGT